MLLVRNIRLPLTCPDSDAEAAAKAEAEANAAEETQPEA